MSAPVTHVPPQFIEFVTEKLEENGVERVIPDEGPA
jgi:hypothetical protein